MGSSASLQIGPRKDNLAGASGRPDRRQHLPIEFEEQRPGILRLYFESALRGKLPALAGDHASVEDSVAVSGDRQKRPLAGFDFELQRAVGESSASCPWIIRRCGRPCCRTIKGE